MISLLTGSALWSAFGSGWFGRAAGHMLSDLEAVWKWLAADLWRLVAAVVLIAWGVDHVSCHRHAARVEKQLASTTKALGDLRAQFDQTVANYRAAAVKAAADDAANKARVEQQQAQISKEQSNEYEARIAAARATIASLQRAARPANPGSPAKPSVPGLPTPTCGTDAPTDDPATRAYDCAIQLDELITEVQRLHTIDVNGKQ